MYVITCSFCCTSVLDCTETFSKGVHRSLVPLESSADNVVAVELVESAPGYRMLTQMDVVRFLRAHGAELRGVLSRTVRELGAVNDTVFAVAGGTIRRQHGGVFLRALCRQRGACSATCIGVHRDARAYYTTSS